MSWLVALGFMGLSIFSSHAAGPQVYVVDPPITDQAILVGQPLPGVCKAEKTIRIMACRGEYEPASFLVTTEKRLEAVRVEIGPLTGSAGTLPAEAVDVRVVQPYFRRVTSWPATMPWLLVHDPGLFTIVDEPQPHALEKDAIPSSRAYTKTNRLSREAVDRDTLQPGDIKDFRQFWLTVHIPQDARAGMYHGAITITAANAPATTLTLKVTVPSFDLRPPQFEYSVYYPVSLERADGQKPPYPPVTEQQYLAECRNMVAHGCMNPNIYEGPEQDSAGNIHFAQLSRMLDLREKAGVPKGVMLYLFNGAGMPVREGTLTEPEKQRSIEVARATVAWAKARGYLGARFMGADEFSGDRLRAMRDSYAAVCAGGSGIWVACGADFLDIVGDLVDRPILCHPGHSAIDNIKTQTIAEEALRRIAELARAGSPELLLQPDIQRMIRGAHQKGFKIFTYMDPLGGEVLPALHRRNRGLGLWKAGLDGTMTWSYTHLGDDRQSMIFSLVYRGKAAPIDTLAWEGYREGYDDARYLATLQDALAKAKVAGRHAELVGETLRWLDNQTVGVDLDAWRLEMARRTEALLKPQVHK